MRTRDRTYPSDRIIERGVELWCRAIRRPSRDNGDVSERGILAAGLSNMALDATMAKVEHLDARIEMFRAALTERLKFLREHDGEETGTANERGEPRHHYFNAFLSTDYHPDPDLRLAAEAAGLPPAVFSWKSTVQLLDDCVGASFGYGAPYHYHYPLSDGSWLVCRLRGEDMPLIVAAIEAGTLTGLEVERSTAPRPSARSCSKAKNTTAGPSATPSAPQEAN